MAEFDPDDVLPMNHPLPAWFGHFDDVLAESNIVEDDDKVINLLCMLGADVKAEHRRLIDIDYVNVFRAYPNQYNNLKAYVLNVLKDVDFRD